MLNSLISKAVQISVITLMTSTCLTSNIPIETEYEEPVEIVETVSLPRTHKQIIDDLKKEVRYTANWNDRGTDTTIQVCYEDAVRLMKIAYSEGGNQGIDGQLRIMQVVWNRVNSDKFPNSIEEVISQDGQFESYQNGSYFTATPTWETHQALAEFESNRNSDTEIVAFETTSNRKSLERYFTYCYTLESHDFYVTKIKKN